MEESQQQAESALASAGKAINWHSIRFSPFSFKDILALEITQEINEHAKLHISGTLPDSAIGANQDYVQRTTENTPVTLEYLDGTGTEKILFKGLVTDISQRTLAGLKHLDIEAVSFSYQLDVIKHSRSFQRHEESYSYIFERINTSAREVVPHLKDDVVKAEGNEDQQTTGRLIVQYQETEWQFLKRLASHFNIGLTPDITFDSPKVYFGLPPEPQQNANRDNSQENSDQKQEAAGPELNVSDYIIRRNTKEYAVASKNNRKNSGVAFSENDFTYCEAKSLDILQLGQKVTFLGLNWYIRAIHTTMEKGAVNNTYTLSTKQGLMQDDLYNTRLSGISLHGVVKEVTKDQVKAHITAIDNEWDEGATWYFPYTTIYSSPDGSGWYCMPEVGDNVRIYFPSSKEEEAVAASSVNLTPSKRGKREDPDSKILSNVYGKQVIFNPGGIEIIANDQLLMTLTDDGGVNIKSDKKITLEAEEDIEITSKTSKITVSGMEEVSIQQGAGEINLKQDIFLRGAKVNVQQ